MTADAATGIASGPLTIATLVRDRAVTDPHRIALREKNLGLWEEVDWAGYWDQATLVGHALLSLGVEPGDRIAIHAENRREWLYTDVGAVAVRAVTVGLYPTSPAAEIAHVLADSGATVLVAEDQEQVDKVLAVAEDLPALSTVVYLEPRGIGGHYDDPRLLSWPDFLDRGRAHAADHPDAVPDRMAETDADDLVTLIYTSGTTGPPKGAMLTVRNIAYVITLLVERGGLVRPPASPDDILLSYLPLCHVVERLFSVWLGTGAGAQICFAESIETVQQDLREVQPTIVFGVPRIWEKVVAGVHVRMQGASRVKRAVFGATMRLADTIGTTLVRTHGVPTLGTRLRYAIGWILVFRPLRRHLGLAKARVAVSGAAPIAPEVLQFFMGIGVPMHEAYGMTENSAIATSNRPGRIHVGTVGEPHETVELTLADNGEILTRHPGVFAGYWRNPEATAAALDADGWLHTGDVGTWVDGAHLRITDRIKDIIITAGGKNIAPSEIENALKASPYVKEAVVIGDRRRFVTALIGIELDTVGAWAQQRRLAYTTYRDLAEKPEVDALVQGVVDDVNARLATVEQVKTFRMIPKELDHDQGELTATQKVRRAAIGEQFQALIDSMYEGAS